MLVAQHLPASFTGAFAKRLDRDMPSERGRGDPADAVEAGTIYIGQGDADVMVAAAAGRPSRDAGAGQSPLFVAPERGTHGGQRT